MAFLSKHVFEVFDHKPDLSTSDPSPYAGQTTTLVMIRRFRQFSQRASYALNSDGSSAGHYSWNDYRAELVAFSRKYPDHVFSIDRTGMDGEEDSELVIAHNGKIISESSVVIPPSVRNCIMRLYGKHISPYARETIDDAIKTYTPQVMESEAIKDAFL